MEIHLFYDNFSKLKEIKQCFQSWDNNTDPDLVAILLINKGKNKGTVLALLLFFLPQISTILGAILFLRFGYAVGNVGLLKSLGIILLGHLVTIPTVLAVSEVATNRRVAGGGAYYIVSRSFGTSIGGTIGLALYISQAISIAFYMVAFAQAFDPIFKAIADQYAVITYPIDARWLSIPSTVILMIFMLTKGANMGVSLLWAICVILGISIASFFLGQIPEGIRIGQNPDELVPQGLDLNAAIPNGDSFGIVFATCFPAFTGMIAGLGLSGDLKNPQRSIPLGTISATLAGMVVYVFVAIKLLAECHTCCTRCRSIHYERHCSMGTGNIYWIGCSFIVICTWINHDST